MHVVTSKRRHKDREYETTLVRRSYRDGDRVRKQTLANLSHLPPEAIEAVRRVLRGETLVGAGEALQVERSLGHGHVAAVLGVLRDLDLERLISRERCRERDLCVALICQRLLAAGSKLSATRRFAQTTLAEALGLGTVSERELLSAMDWLLARQARIEHALLKLCRGPLLSVGGDRLLARRQARQSADHLRADLRPGRAAGGDRAASRQHR